MFSKLTGEIMINQLKMMYRIRSQLCLDFQVPLVTSAVNGASLNLESRIAIANAHVCRRKFSLFQSKEITTWASNKLLVKSKLTNKLIYLRNQRPMKANSERIGET